MRLSTWSKCWSDWKKQSIIKNKNIKTAKYILPSKDVDIEKVLVSGKDFSLGKKL